MARKIVDKLFYLLYKNMFELINECFSNTSLQEWVIEIVETFQGKYNQRFPLFKKIYERYSQ